MSAWGVDGCRNGWFYFGIDGNKATFGVISALEELVDEKTGEEDVILVDIPIGLPEGECGERVCDVAARRVLAPARAASVFPVPSRPAVYADTYAAASALNRATIGKGLSKQSWALCPKIREVDQLLQRKGVRSCFAHGYTMQAIAEHAGLHHSTVSRLIKKGGENARNKT